MNLDVEGLQRPTYIFDPKPYNEPFHDMHAETGLGQGPNPLHVHEQVANSVGKGGVECFGKVLICGGFCSCWT